MNRFAVAVLLGACGWGLAAWSILNNPPATPSATATMFARAGPAASDSPAKNARLGGRGQSWAQESRSARGTHSLSLGVPRGRLRFTTDRLTAQAGKVEIKFTNDSLLPHNLTIAHAAGGPVIDATHTFVGGNETLAVRLKPGTYLFFCSVPEHRILGMRGTLSVY